VNRLAFLPLLCLVELAAQPPGANTTVISGSLVQIRQDSISLKLNDKVTVVHITPVTEIWRRGKDLTGADELVLGEDVFVQYTRTAADSSPIATLIAAVEADDAIELSPHHVVEYRVCSGYLTDIRANTISVKSDDGICIMRFAAETEFWRGETSHDPSGLVIGDVVTARATVSYPSGELIAEDVTANITKTHGKVTKVGPGGVVVAEENEQDEPIGETTVLFDEHTIFDEGSQKDLHVGAFLEVIGLDLGHDRMRATRVLSLEAPVVPGSRRP
jgi:hypothetical protein